MCYNYSRVIEYKNLTHSYQVEVHEKPLNDIETKNNRKVEEEKKENCSVINSIFKAKLKKRIIDIVTRFKISKTSWEMFIKLNVTELQDFIPTRTPNILKPKVPKNAKVEDAIQGENCYHWHFLSICNQIC